MCLKLTQKILHPISTITRLKVKEIDGINKRQWKMFINEKVRSKPYLYMNYKQGLHRCIKFVKNEK